MSYLQHYKTELLNSLESIDLNVVDKAVDMFREARAHGRCIFVCGTGSNSVACSHLLCDLLKAASINRSVKFHVFPITDELYRPGVPASELLNDHALADQLRGVAKRGDVVVGISASGNSRSVLRAFEYANEIGCRTVCIASRAGGKLAAVSNTAILVPEPELGGIDDAHMVVCRMLGNYFLNFDHG